MADAFPIRRVDNVRHWVSNARQAAFFRPENEAVPDHANPLFDAYFERLNEWWGVDAEELLKRLGLDENTSYLRARTVTFLLLEADPKSRHGYPCRTCQKSRLPTEKLHLVELKRGVYDLCRAFPGFMS